MGNTYIECISTTRSRRLEITPRWNRRVISPDVRYNSKGRVVSLWVPYTSSDVPPGGAREFLVFWPDKLTLWTLCWSYEVTACGRSFEWGMLGTIKSPAYSEVISVQQRPAICGNGGINMQEITCTMDVFSVS